MKRVHTCKSKRSCDEAGAQPAEEEEIHVPMRDRAWERETAGSNIKGLSVLVERKRDVLGEAEGKTQGTEVIVACKQENQEEKRQ